MPPTPACTLIQFRCFVAVAETLHFGSAAEQLGIRQPSLSRTLSALEDAIGTPLLDRSSRRVILTEQGDQLLFHAKRAVAATDRFLASVHRSSAGPTSFRLGLSHSVAARMVHDALPALRRQFPEVKLLIVEDHLSCMLSRLNAGELDALIGPLSPGVGVGLVAVPLYREDYLLLVSRDDPLSGFAYLSPPMLQNRATVHVDDPASIGEPSCATTMPSRAITVNTAIAWVNGGFGVALVPESVLRLVLLPQALVAIKFTSARPTRTIGIIYDGSPTGNYASFIPILDCLVEQSQWTPAPHRQDLEQ